MMEIIKKIFLIAFLVVLGSLKAQQGSITFFDTATGGINSIGPHDSNRSMRINGEKNVDIVIDEQSQYLDGAFNVFRDGPSNNPLFRVGRDGRVGIGTNTPSTLLNIKSLTSRAELTVSGSGDGAINAGIVLNANHSSNFRGLGVFMHDSGGQNEWFIGRPYAGSDQFVINRRNGVSQHATTTSSLSHNNSTQTTTNFFTVKPSGNVGIGNASPSKKLDVNGSIGAQDFIVVQNGGSYLVALNGQNHGYISGRNSSFQHKFYITSNGTSYLNGGRVGIGTTSPDSKLTVKGNIHAEEVKVDLSVPGPDYVFKEDYNLKSLKEVQNYIKEYGHLPNIPSAKEMEENGVQLGEMNMKLLEKIEELTLYVIELEKENKKMNELETRLQHLEQIIKTNRK